MFHGTIVNADTSAGEINAPVSELGRGSVTGQLRARPTLCSCLTSPPFKLVHRQGHGHCADSSDGQRARLDLIPSGPHPFVLALAHTSQMHRDVWAPLRRGVREGWAAGTKPERSPPEQCGTSFQKSLAHCVTCHLTFKDISAFINI